MIPYDLHFHSTYSDGEWNVDEILAHAKKIGMKVLALTDHDTMAGQKEFLEKSKKAGIQAIPGVEVTCDFEGNRLHILGYGIDFENKALKEEIAKTYTNRANRNELFYDKLASFGFHINRDRLAEEQEKQTKPLRRLQITTVLMEDERNHKLASSAKEIEKEYLWPKGKAYINLSSPSGIKAVELIRNAGGFASLAHPGLDIDKFDDFEHIASELRKNGLKGIEVYSWKHSKEQTKYYREFADKNGYIITFGNDDHGRYDPYNSMGQIDLPDADILIKKIFEELDKLK
ncbi:MAG: PHP domain-containing protein [bacterium]|nr:PHP domain-containing protein [bacterium]